MEEASLFHHRELLGPSNRSFILLWTIINIVIIDGRVVVIVIFAISAVIAIFAIFAIFAMLIMIDHHLFITAAMSRKPRCAPGNIAFTWGFIGTS